MTTRTHKMDHSLLRVTWILMVICVMYKRWVLLNYDQWDIKLKLQFDLFIWFGNTLLCKI